MKRKELIISLIMVALFTGCGQNGPNGQTNAGVPQETLADSSESDKSTQEEEPYIKPDSTGAIEIFDISDPKEFSIKWDSDGDGTKERMEFDFEDQGDEAPSCIGVALYTKDKRIESYIERCYGIEAIFDKEDDDGKYLDIYYVSGDYYYHDTQSQCTLRVQDGEIVLEGDDIY